MGASAIELDEPATPPPSGETKTYGDTAEPNTLLDPKKPPSEVCKYLHDQFKDQHPKYQRLICEGEVNERRRAGESNLWVNKTADRSQWQVYVAPGSHYANAFSRKDDRLCYRFVSQLFADPAQPEAIPSTGEDEDRDAAEFATRVLIDIGSEAGLDDVEAHKQAMHTASSWGSGFIWYYTDPKGGGRKPVEQEALPQAQTKEENDALVQQLKAAGQMPPLKHRYLTDDGRLTDNQAEAALQWQPKLARQSCNPGQIRFWPSTAQDLWDADGLIYADYQPWGVVKGWFAELENATPEQRDHAIGFRLTECRHLLPKKNGEVYDPKPKNGHEDDGLVLLMIHYVRECGTYPDGCYIVCIGDELTPHRGTWLLETDGKREARDIPFTQFLQWRGGRDYPMGKPLMAFLGALDELRGELYGRFGEWLDSLMNQKWFLTPHSMITPEQLQDPFLTLIPTMPGTEPRPMVHPPIPKELPEMIAQAGREMDDASGLQQTGQAMDTGDVNSGRQALAIISQVQAGLQDVVQNVNRGITRAKRIQLQEIRQNYTIPQLLRVTTPDGAYKVERWRNSDLGTTRDVQIKRGTGTGMNPFQKTMMLAEFGKLFSIDQEDLKEVALSGVSHVTAIQDDPLTQRIRRQLYEWEKGPPPGWQEPQAPIGPDGAPLMQPPPMDPLTGLPAMGPDGMPMPGQPVPPPPDPLLLKIWEPTPADRTPIAATKRLREIAKSMCKAKWQQYPPAWRLPVEMEFAAMQQVVTPPVTPPPVTGDPTQPKAESGPGEPPPLQKAESAVIGESADQPSGVTV